MKYPVLRFTAELSSDPTICDLSEAQRRLLLERLSYVIEICQKVDHFKSQEGFREFLNDIELDLWVNIGAPENGSDRPISSWLIHVSWTLECLDGELLLLVDSSIRDRLTSIGDVNSVPALVIWVNQQATSLRASAFNALASTNLASFVAHMIAMDVLLLNALSTLSRARLAGILATPSH